MCDRGFLPVARGNEITEEMDWLQDGKEQGLTSAGRDVPDKWREGGLRSWHSRPNWRFRKGLAGPLG